MTVERDFGLSDTVVSMDADRLRRAVINVYDNACQAAAEGLEKRQEAGVDRGAGHLVVGTRATGGRLPIPVW